MNDKNIYLVGFMGTGKTTVGQRLAERLKRPYLDLDQKIEAAAGRPIRKIFEDEGEAAFRRLEAEAVQGVSRLKNHVISTGGGVMLDEENVRSLKAFGTLVCLTARPEVILERTLPTRAARPLLAGDNPGERIQELLKLRAPAYARADLTIDTSERSVDAIVEQIIQEGAS